MLVKIDVQISPHESKPVILTFILIIAAFTVFVSSRIVESETYLTISLWLFVLIDIGFIVSMVMGIRTKKQALYYCQWPVFFNFNCIFIISWLCDRIF